MVHGLHRPRDPQVDPWTWVCLPILKKKRWKIEMFKCQRMQMINYNEGYITTYLGRKIKKKSCSSTLWNNTRIPKSMLPENSNKFG